LSVNHLWAGVTTPQQAQQVVEGWIQSDPQPLETTLGQKVGDVQQFSDAAGQPLYYVVYLNPSGFVVVAGDDWAEPIIAFSRGGKYSPSPNDPLGALVTQDLAARIGAVRQLQANNARPAAVSGSQSKWNELQQWAAKDADAGLTSISDIRVSPLVQSKWSQDEECKSPCYNYYTPSNYVCGCVATAMSQFMRFHRFPTAGIGTQTFSISVDGVDKTATTRGGDGSGGPYNWDEMTLDPDCGLTTTQRQAIGALCSDAGLSVNMAYAAYGSGADTLQVKDALVGTFGYSNAIKGGDASGEIGSALYAMANPNLDSGYPVILGIRGSGGHAIVADGYGYNQSTLYHHLNMGWAGYEDAWYNLPNIDVPGMPFDMVYKCIYNVYVTGTGEIISGRVLEESGVPVVGATVTAQQSGGGSYTSITNARGIYAFAKIPSNATYTISANKTGYKFGSQTVTTGTSTDYQTASGNLWGVDLQPVASGAPTTQNGYLTVQPGTPTTVTLLGTDDGMPSPPGVLTYVITSLPAHGKLSDPAGGVIAATRYTLANWGNQVIYTPDAGYLGQDSFTFVANDGGVPPLAGDSNTSSISLAVSECSSVRIGTGSTSWTFPMHTYYHDSRIQVIYLASELSGTAGTISALSLDVAGVPGQTMNDWTIRMKHTSLAAYATASLDANGWTVVYRGNEPPGSTGWRTFVFSTPFGYDGVHNLLVDISHNNTSATTNGTCLASSPGGTRTAYAYSDSAYGSPLSWSGTSAPTVFGSTLVPNIQFTVCYSAIVPAAPSGLGHCDNTVSSITWTWNDTSDNEAGFQGEDEVGVPQWNVSAGSITFREQGLAANSPYSRHLHAYNVSGKSDPSASVTAYTSIEASSGVETCASGAVTQKSIPVRSINTPSNLAAGSSGLLVRNKTNGTDSGWKKDNDCWTSDNLVPNKLYQFTVQTRNAQGDLTPESWAAGVWTLPAKPDATGAWQTACPTWSIAFMNTAGFGAGGVDHYHYVWDQNSTYQFNGNEPTVWRGGLLEVTGSNGGRWYLHLLSHNGHELTGGTLDLGPYVGQAVDFNHDCYVDEQDLLHLVQCASGPEMPQNDPACADARLDGDLDVDQDDFAVLQRCWRPTDVAVDAGCR
jgi:hypothetical protein